MSILILLSVSSCNNNQEILSPELTEEKTIQLVATEEEAVQLVATEEAIQLVANECYDGNTNGLQAEKLADNNYLIKLTYDMGTGLISTANAHLVVNGKIIASLINENGTTDDLFYQKVDEYREK